MCIQSFMVSPGNREICMHVYCSAAFFLIIYYRNLCQVNHGGLGHSADLRQTIHRFFSHGMDCIDSYHVCTRLRRNQISALLRVIAGIIPSKSGSVFFGTADEAGFAGNVSSRIAHLGFIVLPL